MMEQSQKIHNNEYLRQLKPNFTSILGVQLFSYRTIVEKCKHGKLKNDLTNFILFQFSL